MGSNRTSFRRTIHETTRGAPPSLFRMTSTMMSSCCASNLRAAESGETIIPLIDAMNSPLRSRMNRVDSHAIVVTIPRRADVADDVGYEAGIPHRPPPWIVGHLRLWLPMNEQILECVRDLAEAPL